MKKLLAVLAMGILASGTAHAAPGMGSMWVGALVGQQTQDGLKPLSYGLSIGSKGLLFGGELQYLTGSKTVGAVDESISQIVGRLDLFPAMRFFYIGPQLSYTTSKVALTAAGKTVSASVSGLLYGGGAGINIPLGPLSIGGEVTYVTGSEDGSSTHVTTFAGTAKLWF